MAYVRQPYPNPKTEQELSFMSGAALDAYAAEVNAWNAEQDRLVAQDAQKELQRAHERLGRKGLPYPGLKTERELSFMSGDALAAYAKAVNDWYDQQDRNALQAAQAQDADLNKRRLALQKTYTSFSGADIVASIRTSGGKPIVFGEIQTISYSIYRPMQPVYSLGRVNPKGVVRGPRTIAGSMIFTVFDRHVLKQVMDSYKNQDQSFKASYGMDSSDIDNLRKYAKTDEMPPFDINISFMNEYGQSATLDIYGIYIMSEGQTMSIEDMITENTMQYIAMDINLMDYGADVDEANPLR
jgi:hypothetical protein